MILRVQDLVKEYRGGTRANDGISLAVEAGEVFGLLGPNGAGKTTLVRQIVGLVAPTSGSIELDGIDVTRDPSRARRVVSFQPQTSVPIDGLTATQAVELTGRLRGLGAGAARERTRDLLEALELEEWARRPGQRLSGGVRRLVGFCMAAVAPGRMVILDEPTNDVDPLRRRYLWSAIRALADSGTTVLLVTHNVLEAERVVDRLAVINEGRVVAAGTPAELKGDAADRLRLELTLAPATPVPSVPEGFRGFVSGRRLLASIPPGAAGVALEWAAARRGEGVADEYSISPTSLEDAYVRMIGRADVLSDVPSDRENHVHSITDAA